MAKAEAPVTWETVEASLRRWHAASDRDALRAALVFLEPQLRLLVPAMVRQSWPADLVEDALHSFLLKLAEVPLPGGIDHPKSYLARALRNHCIDTHQARTRRRESSLEGAPAGWAPATDERDSPVESLDRRQQAERLHAALGKLAVADRIVLKLVHAPEWLDGEEVNWLGQRLAMDRESVRRAVAAAAGDTHALTRIFDPGDDDPEDLAARRLRMERFRRRRARAREKLRDLLQEEL